MLLVEDDDIDAALFERCMAIVAPHIALSRARDGEEALDHIRNARPDLVIMDIRMPKLDGREVLRAVKDDAATAHVPIIMMSSSSADEDIGFCYRHHANAYMLKAQTIDEAQENAEAIVHFWFGVSEKPPQA